MKLSEKHFTILEHKISQRNPRWVPGASRKEAENLVTTLHIDLIPPLIDWLENGTETEYQCGILSIHRIMHLRNVDYLYAIELMGRYMQNPELGVVAVLDE